MDGLDHSAEHGGVANSNDNDVQAEAEGDMCMNANIYCHTQLSCDDGGELKVCFPLDWVLEINLDSADFRPPASKSRGVDGRVRADVADTVTFNLGNEDTVNVQELSTNGGAVPYDCSQQ